MINLRTTWTASALALLLITSFLMALAAIPGTVSAYETHDSICINGDTESTEANGVTSCDTTLVKSLASTPHEPIYIDGNAGFSGPNSSTGITTGSGTESDPYIIEGWRIDAHNGEYAISISNANVWSIIRNCTLFNASMYSIPYGHGLRIQNVMNLTVETSLIFDCYTAIFADHCDSNIFRNNTLNNTTHMGLQLYSTNRYNLIEMNTIHSIAYDGVCLWMNSNYNIVRGNWIHSNTFAGVQAREADGNVISNNTLEDNQSGVEVYYSYVRDMIVESNIILNCSCGVRISGDGDTVRCNSIQDCGIGVRLYQCSDCVVNSNTIDSCGDGVGTEASTLCTISINKIENCSRYAVYLDAFSSFNLVVGNEFWFNYGSTESHSKLCVQASDDGMDNLWDASQRGNFWADWQRPDNDTDGIVDKPYDIDGSAGAKDNYPLATPQAPIPELPSMPLVLAALLSMIVATRAAVRKKAH